MGKYLRLALILVVLAVVWHLRGGIGDVRNALHTAGLLGLAAIVAFHLLPMALCGLSWHSLMPDTPTLTFILGRWVREGVGELAGFLPLSGEMAGMRLLTKRGIRSTQAAAMTVVDITAEVLSQFIFTLFGVSLWLWRYPGSEVTHWSLIGLAISVPVLLAFVVVQRSAMVRLIETLPSRLMPKTWATPETESGLHAAIAGLYSNRRRVLRAVTIHLAAWVTSTGEAGLALVLLGHPLGVMDVLALESVIFALRSAAFAVPAAIGIQEGAYMVVGAALGLPAEVALAVSLLKRGRELTLGVPALFIWHWVEGKSRPASSLSQTLGSGAK
jgi:putative membrane protein